MEEKILFLEDVSNITDKTLYFIEKELKNYEIVMSEDKYSMLYELILTELEMISSGKSRKDL